jgi:hypothetical protein
MNDPGGQRLGQLRDRRRSSVGVTQKLPTNGEVLGQARGSETDVLPIDAVKCPFAFVQDVQRSWRTADKSIGKFGTKEFFRRRWHRLLPQQVRRTLHTPREPSAIA